LSWVLRGRHGVTKRQLIQCVHQLLDSPEVALGSQSAVTQAIARFASGSADFADCLIERSGHATGCSKTVTFDATASQTAGMKLL
jgi:predicted nucleic-acid-binding protein